MTAPSSWSMTTIGELFDIGAGKTVNPDARAGEPKHPFLRTANVFWGRLDVSQVDRMHFTRDDLIAKTLRAGDLLVCEGGDIGRAAIWDGQIPDCGFQNHLHRLRPKRDDIVPAFFMYALQAGFTLHARYEGAGNKTTIPNLSRSRLEALTVPKPPPSEQARIAAVLSLVQRVMEAEEKTITTTRELKQAAMVQLFTTGLSRRPSDESELGLIPRGWVVHPMNRLVTKPDYGVTASATIDPSGPQMLRITDITETGVDWATVPYCKSDPEDESRTRLRTGDIVIARIGATTGKSFLVREAPAQAVFASYLIRLRATRDLEPRFLYHFCNTRLYWRQIDAQKDANLKGGVNASILAALRVPVPPTLAEQQAIADALDAIDASILVGDRRLRAVRALFTSLLDKFMTGEIRVDKLNIDTSDVAGAKLWPA